MAVEVKSQHACTENSLRTTHFLIVKVIHENDKKIIKKKIPLILPRSYFSTILSNFMYFHLKKFIYFLLKDNCFTEFCYFLSDINTNQP